MENDREQERGKSVMEKKYLFMTGIAVSAALWCRQRNKKYPLAAGYPLLNKFIIPESFLSCHIMRIANRQLAAMKQPSPPRGIKRMRKSDICFQMLIYPVLDARMKTESMKKYTDSPVWNAHLSKKMLDIRCSALRRAFNEVLQQSACRSEGLRDTADQ